VAPVTQTLHWLYTCPWRCCAWGWVLGRQGGANTAGGASVMWCVGGRARGGGGPGCAPGAHAFAPSLGPLSACTEHSCPAPVSPSSPGAGPAGEAGREEDGPTAGVGGIALTRGAATVELLRGTRSGGRR